MQTTYKDKSIIKEDVFWYVYGVLHSPEYKQRFAVDLKKGLPRLPLAGDFWAFSKAGKKLGTWHLEYEEVNGGRPVLARGQCGSISATSSPQGTTRSICSRNTRLRVFFTLRSNPRLACCIVMLLRFAGSVPRKHQARVGVLQTFPRSQEATPITSTIFFIERGQLMCGSYEDCTVLVRFDEAKPERFSAIGPADNSSDTVFIRQLSRAFLSWQSHTFAYQAAHTTTSPAA
jgi:hypothetical protein